jgi:hypothetical protein
VSEWFTEIDGRRYRVIPRGKLYPAPGGEGDLDAQRPVRPVTDPGEEAHVKRDASSPSSACGREHMS